MHFTRSHYILIIINALYLGPLAIKFLIEGNWEFFAYVGQVIALLVLLMATIKKTHFPVWLLALLSGWAALHMAGGAVHIGDGVLYAYKFFHIVGEGDSYVLKYDQVIHFYGFFTTAFVAYWLMLPQLKPGPALGFGQEQNTTPRPSGANPCGGAADVAHYYGVIRNNMVSADRPELFSSGSGFDGGIALAKSCETDILHNTVMSTQAPFASMEWRFENTTGRVTNNLVSHNYMPRNGSVMTEAGNLDSQPLTMIADVSVGNLHLDPGAAAAIDQGVTVPAGDCDEDYDAEPRDDGSPDIGADEI